MDTQGDAFFVAFPTAEGAAAAAVAAGRGAGVWTDLGSHGPAHRRTAGDGRGIRGDRRASRSSRRCPRSRRPDRSLAGDGGPPRRPRAPRPRGAPTEGLRGRDAPRPARRRTEFPPLRSPGSVDLPTPATRFLGRERELFEAVSLVYDRDPRVLTILGPGGTGKTRFALELCRLLAEEADGGTVFCPLAPLREPELVLTTIAERLGAGSADAASIAARVGDKRTHVLVDNVEHLLPHAASPLALLAEAAPSLRLVVTSREALRVRSEVELDLPPLAEREAVDLFLARAQAVRPDLEEERSRSRALRAARQAPARTRARGGADEASLTRRASRTTRRPASICSRAPVTSTSGTRPSAQRSRGRTTCSARTSSVSSGDSRVFRGGCTLESAERVCDADLDTLASLLDKSLVRRRTGRLGEERFWMLETIREFAESSSTESRRGPRASNAATPSACSRSDVRRISAKTTTSHSTCPVVLAERDDVRAALDWAAEADAVLGLELACALESFWGTHAPAEGMRRFDELLEGDVEIPPLLRAGALRNLAGAAHQERNWAVCRPALRGKPTHLYGRSATARHVVDAPRDSHIARPATASRRSRPRS